MTLGLLTAGLYCGPLSRRWGDGRKSGVGGRSRLTGRPLSGSPLLNVSPRAGDRPTTAFTASPVVV